MTTLTEIFVNASQGLTKTLQLMNELESLSMQNPIFVKFVNDNFNSECKACIPGKIWNFMQKYFRYVPDDPYDEILTAPYIMIDQMQGDCDDFALFAKTCLDILGGFNTNYLLLGKNKNEFSHIVVFSNRGKINNLYKDAVIIDGVNPTFNSINPKYKFQKII